MSKKGKFQDSQKQNSGSKLTTVLACIALVLLIFVIWFALYTRSIVAENAQETKPEHTAPETTVAMEPPEETQNTKPAEDPTEPESTILPQLEAYYNENPDMCGWITIEGTEVDYPLMYTPDDPEKYLRRNFEGDYSVAGLPFMDDACSLDPESDNLIFYGHNMLDGSMFRTIMAYKDESYWREHPAIRLCTLYEEREYEVLAAFYDRVYYTYEDCFKFYQFIDAEDQAAYNEAISYYKENAEYDTGVEAEYGDRLLTLVTCSYHHEYGRFVVVAREVKD